MYYYEVLVSSSRYHGNEALTYQSEEPLAIGTVVSVPIRSKNHLGFILRESKKPTYRTKSITLALTNRPVPHQLLSLLSWLRDFYPAPLGLIAQQALPSALLLTKAPAMPKEKSAQTATKSLPKLSRDQEKIVREIRSGSSKHFLLHGDTGTGKTRIYMETAKSATQQGRSAMIITPEIGLTPQLVRAFEEHFSEEIIVLHSHQTAAERRNEWLRILYSDSPMIIIGPRSALFAPVRNLGVVVIDESHDNALKQDSSPRYHAVRVGAKLSLLHDAIFMSGSATPRISDYWLAEQSATPILRMTTLPQGKMVQRTTELVDIKDRSLFSKSQHLSDSLISAIGAALSRQEQSLVFLNRRGTARLILCQECGWNAVCPTCDLPLTYHGDHHEARCHTCGFHQSAPTSCPKCSSVNIKFKSIGTKSLTEELQRLFPRARVRRYDTDNNKSERIETDYQTLASGDIDIIVGTQLVTKGLDLPHLSVVGVVVADTSLYLPDFSAEEQTYQMLRQVIGRVGRGHKAGTAIIQTYQPRSTTINSALGNNWTTFYSSQLRERREFGFPPYYHFLKLTISRASSNSAEKASKALEQQIMQQHGRVLITGPSPTFHEKVAGKYRWQLIVKAKDRGVLVDIVNSLPNGWTADLDPLTLL